MLMLMSFVFSMYELTGQGAGYPQQSAQDVHKLTLPLREV